MECSADTLGGVVRRRTMLSALAVGHIKRFQALAMSVAGARRVAPMMSAAGGV
jgi:hypothetical protein